MSKGRLCTGNSCIASSAVHVTSTLRHWLRPESSCPVLLPLLCLPSGLPSAVSQLQASSSHPQEQAAAAPGPQVQRCVSGASLWRLARRSQARAGGAFLWAGRAWGDRHVMCFLHRTWPRFASSAGQSSQPGQPPPVHVPPTCEPPCSCPSACAASSSMRRNCQGHLRGNGGSWWVGWVGAGRWWRVCEGGVRWVGWVSVSKGGM